MLLNAVSYLLGNSAILLFTSLPEVTAILAWLAGALIIIFIAAWLVCRLKYLWSIPKSFQVATSRQQSSSLKGQWNIIRITQLLLIMAIALAWGLYQAKQHQQNILPPELQKQPITVVGYIDSFPQLKPGAAKFNFVVQQVLNEPNIVKTNLSTLDVNKITHVNKCAHLNKAVDINKTTQLNKITDISKLNLGTIKLNWHTDVQLRLGQRWQLTVKLKRPRGFANPGSFDAEKHNFQQRITAVGYVDHKAAATLLDAQSFTYEQQARQWIYTRIIAAIGEREFCSTILALTLGLQQAVPQQHWKILQQTGVAHLLAISGMHIGLVAGMAYACAAWLWSRVPGNCLLVPSPRIGAGVAFLAALSYAFLAGFAVSAKRACIMIAVAMLAIFWRRKSNSILGFAWALIGVLVLDPLAVLSTSFWLSFVAVAILLYTLTGRGKIYELSSRDIKFGVKNPHNNRITNKTSDRARKCNKVKSKLLVWIKPQLVLTIGLLPLGISYFGNLVLIAPLANLIVIPYVSLLIVPLSLLGVMLAPVTSVCSTQCWQIAEKLFALIWPWLLKLQELPMASIPMQEPKPWQLVIASIGAIWILAPKGFPGRCFGWYGLLMLVVVEQPVDFKTNKQYIIDNEFNNATLSITMLDVGQGLAIVLNTAKHTLLYDTGPSSSEIFNRIIPNVVNKSADHGANLNLMPESASDAGELVVWPYLRSQGIKKLDKIMVSHADLDHAGGLKSILQHIVPEQILTPDIAALKAEGYIRECRFGKHWEWDGVNFEILHPQIPLSKKRNEQSCVLKVTTKLHSILFTGDISSKVEKQLLQHSAEKLGAEVLIIPHHGSKSSSDLKFIGQVKPRYALASVGYLNSYGHPRPSVVDAYKTHGSLVLDTAVQGAIRLNFSSDSRNIHVNCYRMDRRKFWHDHGEGYT